MNAHLRANLWLLGATLLLGCVVYPLILWTFGKVVFPHGASGSLIDEAGRPTREIDKARGSRLIAQPFHGPEYFQPRPSAPSYDASASGGSNYSVNNPKLRARVAQTLGPLVKYRRGPRKNRLAGPDIEKWFQQDRFKGEPHIVAQWAITYPFLAQTWVSAHPKEVAEWLRKNPGTPEPKPEDLAVSFFVRFSHAYPGKWPGKIENGIEPVAQDTMIQANFFDMWLQDHADVELIEVPADRVMASGSGLDPHITLKNARYQLDRVVGAWIDKTGADPVEVRKAIEELLNQKAAAPFGGLAGVKLINVLEVNLALAGAMQGIPK